MTMTYAIWTPGEHLQLRRMRHGEVEALVGGRHSSATGVQLWRRRELLLKLQVNDVGLVYPDDYPRHGQGVSAFVVKLGGPLQTWAGTIAVYAIDSAEGGWPVEMGDEQRAAIDTACREVTGRPAEVAG